MHGIWVLNQVSLKIYVPYPWRTMEAILRHIHGRICPLDRLIKWLIQLRYYLSHSATCVKNYEINLVNQKWSKKIFQRLALFWNELDTFYSIFCSIFFSQSGIKSGHLFLLIKYGRVAQQYGTSVQYDGPRRFHRWSHPSVLK